MTIHQKLKKQVEKQIARLRQAEKDQPTILAYTVYLGTLGLLLVLPTILGAYVGRWLDSLSEGYSVRWTVSLILVGLFIGAINVYLLIRE